MLTFLETTCKVSPSVLLCIGGVELFSSALSAAPPQQR